MENFRLDKAVAKGQTAKEATNHSAVYATILQLVGGHSSAEDILQPIENEGFRLKNHEVKYSIMS